MSWQLHTGAHTVRKDDTTTEFLLGTLWRQLETERKNISNMNPWLAGRHICTHSTKARYQSLFSQGHKKDVFVALSHFLFNVAWDSLT